MAKAIRINAQLVEGMSEPVSSPMDLPREQFIFDPLKLCTVFHIRHVLLQVPN
jgi:hypothetical protein